MSFLRKNSSSIILYLLTVIIIVGGVWFWTSDLSSDPPAYFSGRGQSLATDPAHYVYHARNQVLFDDPDPFDYPRWTVFQHSLISLIGYVCFSVAGVSREIAAITGIIPIISGLILLLLAIARYHRTWLLPLIALLFFTNVTLFTYGRLPYQENGLIFLCALTYYLFTRFGHARWGLILTGITAAAAIFVGKLFGALMIPALILTIWFSADRDRIARILTMAGSFAGASLLLVFALYGDTLAAASSYVGEQSYGLRGFPAGLSSPWGFFEQVISYGYKMHLFYLNPDILIFIVIAGSAVILLRRPDDEQSGFRALPSTVQMALIWVGVCWVGLAVLNYSPIRYTLLFLPAAMLVAFLVFDILYRGTRKQLLVIWPGWIGMSVVAALIWTLVYHTVANFFFFNIPSPPIRVLTWTTVAVVPLVLLFGYLVLKKRKIRIGRFWLVGVMVFILALSLTVNGFRIRRLHYLDNAFTIAEATEDLSQILGKNAVLSGPYGAGLTLGNNLPSFIHMFGVSNVDSTLFDRYPITHLAVDISNSEQAIKAYPQIGSLKAITTYWIRDIEVKIYNISQVFNNPIANQYQLSHFEKAVGYYLANQNDSAVVELELHFAGHVSTRSAELLYCNLLWKQRQYQLAVSSILKMAEKYRQDWNIQMQAAKMIQVMAIMQESNQLLAQSRDYYERASLTNRFRGDEAMKTYFDLLKTVGKATKQHRQQSGQTQPGS